jgi:hypothetical protein
MGWPPRFYAVATQYVVRKLGRRPPERKNVHFASEWDRTSLNDMSVHISWI